MSSQEFKKKEKGKEVVTFEESPGSSIHHFDHFEHIEEGSMFFSEQNIVALLQDNKETCRENSKLSQFKNDNPQVGNQENQISSSKITPFIFYTSNEKARLRWTSDLQDCFVNAVTKLGGPNKATPKRVKEIMEVEGIALHHVKSRLQKFRRGKCNIRNETSQSTKRFKTNRSITKTPVTSNSPRTEVNIKPKVVEFVKPKKEKEVQGSLYMRIKHDLHLQRRHEDHRMQMDLAMENHRNMCKAQYVEAGMTPSVNIHHNNYMSTTTARAVQPTSQDLEDQLAASSYQIPPKKTNQFEMNNPQQQNTTISQTIPSLENLCNDNIACLSRCEIFQHTSNACSLYEPHRVNNSLIYSNQSHGKSNEKNNYTVAQGFINPYMTIEPQSMHDSSAFTTQQQLQLNGECVIQNSYHNATCLPSTILPTMDYIHQGTSSNSIPLSATPQSIQTYVPHQVYNSYPPYNTLEVVEAKLDALQNSNSSQVQETHYLETNLRSSCDDVDLVDMYIDWDKVEDNDFELDPVEVLLALGFGVSP